MGVKKNCKGTLLLLTALVLLAGDTVLSTNLLYSSRLTPPPHHMSVHLSQLSQHIAAWSSSTLWPHMVHGNSQLATAELLGPGLGWMTIHGFARPALPQSSLITRHPNSAMQKSRLALKFYPPPSLNHSSSVSDMVVVSFWQFALLSQPFTELTLNLTVYQNYFGQN